MLENNQLTLSLAFAVQARPEAPIQLSFVQRQAKLPCVSSLS